MKKGTEVFLILGSHLYLPPMVEGEAWTSVKLNQIEDAAAAIAERGPRRVRLIYEPASLSSEEIEVPKASRATLRSLPELQQQHPALMADHLGWGFQEAWNSGSGSRTILHTENTNALYPLIDRLATGHILVEGAWAATSLGFGRGNPSNPWALLLLDRDEAFFYSEVKGNRVPIKFDSIDPANPEGFWRVLRDNLESHGFVGPTSKNAEVIVLSNIGPGAKIADDCAWWQAWSNNARVTIETFDVIAERAAQWRPRSDANLVEAFPRPFDFTPIFQGFAALTILGALALGAFDMMELRRKGVDEALVSQELSKVQVQRDLAQARKQEQDKLTALYGDNVVLSPPSRATLLKNIGISLLPEFSISDLKIDQDGQVTLTGVEWLGSTPSNDAVKHFDQILSNLQTKFAEFQIDTARTLFDPTKKAFTISGRLLRKQTSASTP